MVDLLNGRHLILIELCFSLSSLSDFLSFSSLDSFLKGPYHLFYYFFLHHKSKAYDTQD